VRRNSGKPPKNPKYCSIIFYWAPGISKVEETSVVYFVQIRDGEELRIPVYFLDFLPLRKQQIKEINH
jgi:hypothetical protein